MLKKYTKPYPTIGDIIAGKNFDYVSYRGYDEKRNSPPALPDGTVEGEFCGCFKVVNSEIVPLDGDSYYDSEDVIASEEWTMPDEGIEKGRKSFLRRKDKRRKVVCYKLMETDLRKTCV